MAPQTYTNADIDICGSSMSFWSSTNMSKCALDQHLSGYLKKWQWLQFCVLIKRNSSIAVTLWSKFKLQNLAVHRLTQVHYINLMWLLLNIRATLSFVSLLLVFLSHPLCCGPVGRTGHSGQWKSRRIHQFPEDATVAMNTQTHMCTDTHVHAHTLQLVQMKC